MIRVQRSGAREYDPFDIDGSTLERLLSGSLDAGDAPPAYAAVAECLGLARASVVFSPSGEAETVATLVSSIHRNPHNSRRRRIVLAKIATAKLTALTAAGVLSAGGVAAAATGSLPSPVQDAVSAAASQVGVPVPSSTTTSGTDATDTTDTTDSTSTSTSDTTGTTSGDTTTTTVGSTTSTTSGSTTGTSGSTGSTTTTTVGSTTSGTTAPSGAPTTCPTGFANHGAYVSSVAHSTPKGKGHGQAVSQAARCTPSSGASPNGTSWN